MAVATTSIERVVLDALAEDVGSGDVTSEAVVDAHALGTAALLLKERGVVCGIDAVEAVFRALDPEMQVDRLFEDGTLRRGRDGRRGR